jgi:hypothetical protein
MGGPSVEQIEPLLFPSANNDDQEAIQPSPQRKATIAALCVVILAAVDSGLVEVLVALVRIYEDIVCSNYYAIHDPSIISPGGHPPEAMCKIEPVQSELAFIRGFEGVFSTLPSEYSSIDDKNTCKIRSMLTASPQRLTPCSSLWTSGR